MTDHPLRFFADSASIRRTGEAFLDHTLPKEGWTHEAHLATCLWLHRERADIVPARDLPRLIPAFNVAKGGVNDDTSGYHETLTQAYVRGVGAFLAGRPADEPLVDSVNALLASEMGPRDWPLRFWSRAVLFSVAARRGWVEPDLAPLP